LFSFVNRSGLLQRPISRLLSLSTLFYCFAELDQIGVFLQWADALLPYMDNVSYAFCLDQLHPKFIQPEQGKRANELT